jgi:YebC/PmpR family DNA-binding regulatory protein
MSGHSHWATIKRAKEAADKKKGKIFSKVSRLIYIAVKEKGDNIDNNPRLKMAIEEAKRVNMPKENIERAIQKGLGKIDAEKLEEFVFEAIGPGKIAIIIEGITDNKNRVLGEIKNILSQYNGKMANEGSVKWLFEKKGVLTVDVNNQSDNLKDKDQLELLAIECGAEDIQWENDILEIYVEINSLEEIKKCLEDKNIKINSSSLDWVAKDTIEVEEKDKEMALKLFEALDDNDSVQNIYSNLKI